MRKIAAPTVNSWLEDELVPAVRHDRMAWIRTGSRYSIRTARNGAPAGEPAAGTASCDAATRARPLAPGDQLVPLRGPALRIAENMTASLAIPVATSQRVMPVKVIEENRRLINQHAHRQEKALLHAPDRVGHREGARKSSGLESGIFGKWRPAVPHHPRSRESGRRRGRRGQRRRPLAQSSVD